MSLIFLDIVAFFLFMGVVMAVSLYAGRKEKTSEDYFLAGRQLSWWLIGFSLIASNISTEHFVGMAGSAFGRVGLAIASYEWMAAIMLVFVAWWLLPRFLKAGIYTMPEFLEYRYDSATRSIMALYLMGAYILVFLATVVYSGAVGLTTIFVVNEWFEVKFGMSPEDATFWANVSAIWLIGIIAGIYTIYGGLKAVVWSDLIQGGALLLGGLLVTWLGMRALGDGSIFAGWETFVETNQEKLHTVLPWNDPDVPWLAVFVGGLWIPNCFYWGLNQFITQRTLGAKNLAEGQKGIFLAAAIKLMIPFIIVFPGIIAFQLYQNEIPNGDMAYPYLIRHLLPPYLRGIMFAALCGAVMSSFNSGINSASTIFTVDLYRKYSKRGEVDTRQEVFIGRCSTAVIMVVACLWAPIVSQFEGVFNYIQEIWGFITPGIVAAFLVGLVFPKTPAIAAKTGLLLSVPLYALCRTPKWIYDWSFQSGNPNAEKIPVPVGWFGTVYSFSSWAFLHHQFIIFLVLVLVMLAITKKYPLREPRVMPVSNLDVTPHPLQYPIGLVLIGLTALLYFIFW
ncbi:MAG: solute:sodium symporter family transporter [Candidatus Omnitrophica bacterium]|nr:solute:sodium symporter family transporter [Candidatus Omnitrophota bacterium]